MKLKDFCIDQRKVSALELLFSITLQLGYFLVKLFEWLERIWSKLDIYLYALIRQASKEFLNSIGCFTNSLLEFFKSGYHLLDESDILSLCATFLKAFKQVCVVVYVPLDSLKCIDRGYLAVVNKVVESVLKPLERILCSIEFILKFLAPLWSPNINHLLSVLLLLSLYTTKCAFKLIINFLKL